MNARAVADAIASIAPPSPTRKRRWPRCSAADGCPNAMSSGKPSLAARTRLSGRRSNVRAISATVSALASCSGFADGSSSGAVTGWPIPKPGIAALPRGAGLGKIGGDLGVGARGLERAADGAVLVGAGRIGKVGERKHRSDDRDRVADGDPGLVVLAGAGAYDPERAKAEDVREPHRHARRGLVGQAARRRGVDGEEVVDHLFALEPGRLRPGRHPNCRS